MGRGTGLGISLYGQVSTPILNPWQIDASNKLTIDPAISLTLDQSGNGNNLLTNIGVTSGSGINGNSSAEFSGAANFTGPALSTYVSASGWTLFYSIKDNGSPADVSGNYYSNACIFGDASSASGGYLMAGISSTKIRFGQTGNGSQGLATTISAGTVYRIIHKFDGSKIYVSVNGAAFDSGTTQTNITNLTQTTRIGVNQISTAKYFKGSLGVFGTFNTSLAGDPTSVGSKCAQLYSYMLSKG